MPGAPRLTPLLAILFVLQAPPSLAASDLSISEAPFGRHGRAVSASFHVAASTHAIFAVLTDYDGMPEFMPMVEEAELLESRPSGARVRFRVRSLGLFDIEEIDERNYEPPRRITWQAVKGPLAVSEGSWTLTPDRAGTRVVYQTNVEPPVPLPAFLTGMLVKQGLPEFLVAIRLRAESGGRWLKPGYRPR
ncbi:MAG: SRPBCC family protein [Candidatus Sericytochromatia bacterium]